MKTILKRRKHRLGFTLVEILLVSAMFAVIALAVFNAFSNGFKLWARGTHVMLEGDIIMFLDRIADDLRQTVTITGIPFKGDSTQLSFPAIIRAPADANSSRAQEGIVNQLGAVRYVYDPDQKKIFRSQAVYGQALKEEWSEPVEVANLIEDITMRYYFNSDQGVTVKTQADKEIPMGIMIDVQYSVDGHELHMRRYLIVPVGGGI